LIDISITYYYVSNKIVYILYLEHFYKFTQLVEFFNWKIYNLNYVVYLYLWVYYSISTNIITFIDEYKLLIGLLK